MTMAMPGAKSVFVVTSEREPIIKVVRFKVISSLNNFTVLIPALKKEETVMPARMMVVRLLSAIYARAKIRSVVRKAPVKAKMALWAARPWKIASPIITVNPAPELTPMVFGLARELFITVCKITPAQDKPMPAAMAPNIRGILI